MKTREREDLETPGDVQECGQAQAGCPEALPGAKSSSHDSAGAHPLPRDAEVLPRAAGAAGRETGAAGRKSL